MRIFLSYANAPSEEVVVAWLARLLNASGVDVWLDVHHLRAASGYELNADIAQAIRSECDALLYLASAQSVLSGYCRAEVAFALEIGKPIATLIVEPCELPDGLLPLNSIGRPVVRLYKEIRDRWALALVNPLAEIGVDLKAVQGAPPDLPTSRIVRPRYPELIMLSPDALGARVVRLREARALAPGNGFNELSLAFILLHVGNAPEALASAKNAASLLPLEPAAATALALALCANFPVARQGAGTARHIIDHLVFATSRPSARSPAFLLAAAVACNFYLRRRLTPPFSIAEKLAEGAQHGRIDVDENRRVYALHPIADRYHVAEFGQLLVPYLPDTFP